MSKRFQITKLLSLFLILFALSSCLDLEPDTATNIVGTQHKVTVTVQSGPDLIEGAFITFEIISGPNQGKMSEPNTGECSPDSCITDVIGEVSWTYSSEIAGTDIIVASTFDEEQNLIESDPVEKIWISPANVPTLSQWSLIALAVVFGIIGLLAVRRKNATA
jgi:IPTL-CTERM motif